MSGFAPPTKPAGRYTITKQFAFSAAHQLHGLPATHQCARLHGHNYVVEVVLSGSQLDQRGFVVDYGDLSPLKTYIDQDLDHRNLNEVLGGVLPDGQTTAENIARHLYDWCKYRWPQTVAVRVSETPKTWAEYREGEE